MKEKLNVFVGGSLSRKDKIAFVIKAWQEKYGDWVNFSTWSLFDDNQQPQPYMEWLRRGQIQRNVNEALEADLFLFDVQDKSTTGGLFVELGIAIALDNDGLFYIGNTDNYYLKMWAEKLDAYRDFEKILDQELQYESGGLL